MASDVAVATDAGRNGWRSKEDLEVEKLGQHLKDNAIDIFFSFFFFAPFFLFHKTNETCSFRPRIKRTTTATERRWSDVGKTNKKTTTKKGTKRDRKEESSADETFPFVSMTNFLFL